MYHNVDLKSVVNAIYEKVRSAQPKSVRFLSLALLIFCLKQQSGLAMMPYEIMHPELPLRGEPQHQRRRFSLSKKEIY